MQTALVARTTAKKAGTRVGSERGDVLLWDEIQGEPTQASRQVPITPRN
jgi:hypothetical protein